MNNQEAIERIKGHIAIHKYMESHAIHIVEALEMAISALQAQSKIIRCKDCCFCNLGYDDVGNQYYSCTTRFDENGFWDEVKAEDFCSFAERRTDGV